MRKLIAPVLGLAIAMFPMSLLASEAASSESNSKLNQQEAVKQHSTVKPEKQDETASVDEKKASPTNAEDSVIIISQACCPD